MFYIEKDDKIILSLVLDREVEPCEQQTNSFTARMLSKYKENLPARALRFELTPCVYPKLRSRQ